MKTLQEHNEQIVNAIGDLSCKMIFNKTCRELVADIIENILKEKS